MFRRQVLARFVAACVAASGCAVDASDEEHAAAVQVTSELAAEAQLVRAFVPALAALRTTHPYLADSRLTNMPVVAASLGAPSALVSPSALVPGRPAQANAEQETWTTAQLDSVDPVALEGVSATVAAHAMAALSPSACVRMGLPDGAASPRANPNSAPLFQILHLDGCTGPLGKIELSGDIQVRAVLVRRQLQIEFSSANLRAETRTAATRPLELRGHTAFGADASGAFLQWNTPAGAGNLAAAPTNLRIRDDVSCALLAGTTSKVIGAVAVDIAIEDYQVCGDRCPTAGRVARVRERREGVTSTRELIFDGSAFAQVSAASVQGTTALQGALGGARAQNSAARPTRVALSCTP